MAAGDRLLFQELLTAVDIRGLEVHREGEFRQYPTHAKERRRQEARGHAVNGFGLSLFLVRARLDKHDTHILRNLPYDFLSDSSHTPYLRCISFPSRFSEPSSREYQKISDAS